MASHWVNSWHELPTAARPAWMIVSLRLAGGCAAAHVWWCGQHHNLRLGQVGKAGTEAGEDAKQHGGASLLCCWCARSGTGSLEEGQRWLLAQHSWKAAPTSAVGHRGQQEPFLWQCKTGNGQLDIP